MRAVFLAANLLCLFLSQAPAFEASLYGGKIAQGVDDGFHGKRTACGEIFDMHAMTAAHRTLPCGTRSPSPTRPTGARSSSRSATAGRRNAPDGRSTSRVGRLWPSGSRGVGKVSLKVLATTHAKRE